MKKMIVLILGVALITGHAYAATASAVIKGTSEGSTVSGVATLQDTAEGLKVDIEVAGAPAGIHGIHIHENGSCADMGNAAGGHFNPDHVMHGMVTRDGLAAAHAGDMGNIEISAGGNGTLTMLIPGVTITGGKYNVEGKAIILHEKQDDFGQPTGNAGGRIGCGLIEVQS